MHRSTRARARPTAETLRAILSTALVVLALLTFAAAQGACSLGNVKQNDCASDTECASAFGPGSACMGGFCSPVATCATGHDCRKNAGGGACVNGVCQATFPTDPACMQFTEPPNLLTMPASGPNAPLVIGGIFSLAAPHDQALTDPIRLAVKEINANGGLNKAQQIGVVFCDNGGPGDMATGTTRAALDGHALDYLAGTLGVPYIVGPLTSADSIVLVADLLKKQYPTVLISPSATSTALTTIDDKLSSSDPYGLFWRTCPDDSLQAQVLALDVIGKVTPAVSLVTIVYINDAYGVGLSTGFQNDFGLSKTTLVPYQDTTPGDPTALAALGAMAAKAGGGAVLIIAEHGSIAVQIIEAMYAADPTIANKPFFLTDGSMDNALTDPTLPAWLKTLLSNAQGTAPASPSGQNYDLFNANLMAQFQISGTSVSFLAEAYDATYVGAYGVVYASKGGGGYDGRDVAVGMAHLESGPSINLGPLQWTTGKDDLVMQGGIDIHGTSGPLQFDPKTGEAPGPILVWGIGPTGFTTAQVVQPM